MNESKNIQVNLYDGGGIEVTLENYRPVSLHCRALSASTAATVVADAVAYLVEEWVQQQKKKRRIRTV